MSDIQEVIDRLEAPEAEPQPEPTEKIKRRKKPMSKEYMRDYYHRTKIKNLFNQLKKEHGA